MDGEAWIPIKNVGLCAIQAQRVARGENPSASLPVNGGLGIERQSAESIPYLRCFNEAHSGQRSPASIGSQGPLICCGDGIGLFPNFQARHCRRLHSSAGPFAHSDAFQFAIKPMICHTGAPPAIPTSELKPDRLTRG